MPRTKDTALGGLVLHTERAALDAPPLTSTDFHDLRTHGPRIEVDGISASTGTFVARVFASVTTAEGGTGCGSILPAADTVFASGFAVPIEGDKGPSEALAAAMIVAQPTTLSRSSTQETDSDATTGPIVSASASLGTAVPSSATPPSDRISTRRHRRTATATGNAPPTVEYGFGPGEGAQPFARRAITASQLPRPRPTSSTAVTSAPDATPVHTVTIPSNRSRAEPTGIPLLRLPSTPGDTPTAPTKLDALNGVDELQFVILSRDFRMPTGSENSRLSRRAMTLCATSLSAGRRPGHPTYCRLTSRTNIPPFEGPGAGE